jgi:hypothetical protein
MTKPWDPAYMADCILDWREEIADARANSKELMWIQPWLLEQLLDRLQDLEPKSKGEQT